MEFRGIPLPRKPRKPMGFRGFLESGIPRKVAHNGPRRATKPKPGPGRGLWRGAARTPTLWDPFEKWTSGACPGFTKFVQDRTEARRKLMVQGGQVARFSFFPLRPWSPLRNSRSWRVLASANRRDWSVRNSKCFCRSFHLSRNDRIAKGIVARNAFSSDGYPF